MQWVSPAVLPPRFRYLDVLNGRIGGVRDLKSQRFESQALHLLSGKKKAHKQKRFGPVGLGDNPGYVRGTNRGSLLILRVEAQFVPATSLGSKGGTKSSCVKS